MGTDRGEGRRATPEEVRQAEAAAEALFGPGARLKVAPAAKAFGGLGRVLKALEWAGRKKAQSWGYVLTTLKSWEAEGGPPPDPRPAEASPPKLSASAERARKFRELIDSTPVDF